MRTGRDVVAVVLLMSLRLCSLAGEEYSVYPRIVQERSTKSNLVLRINDDITLNLEKSEVLAENMLFVTASQERHEVETVDTSSIQEKLYHDSNERSSLVVHQTDGTLHVEGVVNRKLRIKPSPEGERSAQGHMLHTLYEVKEIRDELVKVGAYAPDYLQGNAVTGQHQQPQVVYPAPHHFQNDTSTTTTTKPVLARFVVEVHIVSDEEHSKNFASKTELTIYLAIMVNAMNLRYLEMTAPTIKFKLVGVTMSQADVFASAILGTLEAQETITKLERYYREGHIPGDPDLVYLMTNQDLAAIKQGRLEKGVAGLANIAGVCTYRRVAIGEDVAPSYEGVFVMAHEIAHLLGARHDPRVSGDCSWQAGYLMSYEDGGTNKYKLSTCSMTSIRNTVAQLPISCIVEKASVAILQVRYPRAMPGQRISADAYCKLIDKRFLMMKGIDSEAYAATPPDLAEVCKMRCCYDRLGRTWCRSVAMLEGMTCTEERTCRKAVCGNHTWRRRPRTPTMKAT